MLTYGLLLAWRYPLSMTLQSGFRTFRFWLDRYLDAPSTPQNLARFYRLGREYLVSIGAAMAAQHASRTAATQAPPSRQ